MKKSSIIELAKMESEIGGIIRGGYHSEVLESEGDESTANSNESSKNSDFVAECGSLSWIDDGDDNNDEDDDDDLYYGISCVELDEGVSTSDDHNDDNLMPVFIPRSDLSSSQGEPVFIPQHVRFEDAPANRRRRFRAHRSHSWSPSSTDLKDLDLDKMQDFESDASDDKPVRRPRRHLKTQTSHPLPSLTEQEIRALEDRLEANLYVPVQFLIVTREPRQQMMSDNGEPLFNLVDAVIEECCVCLATTMVRQRECCNIFICDGCLKTYLTTMINQRSLEMLCPNYTCDKNLSRAEITHHLDPVTRDKFYRFITEANESHVKTCPHCNHLERLDKHLLSKKRLSPQEAKVVCQQCGFHWCFPCHAPWHIDITCKQYRKGDQQLRKWAKQKPGGVSNAHKCPKCKVSYTGDLEEKLSA